MKIEITILVFFLFQTMNEFALLRCIRVCVQLKCENRVGEENARGHLHTWNEPFFKLWEGFRTLRCDNVADYCVYSSHYSLPQCRTLLW